MKATELALNRWPDLLAHLGIDGRFLINKPGPCPACGGKDRFRFDNKGGRGTWICNRCGAGDGFALLGLVKGWSFKDAAAEVERIAGHFKPGQTRPSQPAADKREACRRIWGESKVLSVGDPVYAYLLNRTGFEQPPLCIRYHPVLPYRHEDGSITYHPAMIAKVQDDAGNGVAIHRTYLTIDGQKANLTSPKKILGNLPPGAAVRLSAPVERLGIAEGIETAMCASRIFGIPTWSAISAGGLERWKPPTGTRHVLIFGDNDNSHAGQAAAYSLAKRLCSSGLDAEVFIPEWRGDWADDKTSLTEVGTTFVTEINPPPFFTAGTDKTTNARSAPYR